MTKIQTGKNTEIVTASKASIRKAADILTRGGLVALPTETVYGLAANALDGKAVAGIYEAKGRPQFNPLIVHVLNEKFAAQYAEMHETARRLADQFWPGPLTMILPLKPESELSKLCSAGLDTIALRVPAHRTMRAVLSECNLPLAAPSANRSGTLTATTPVIVEATLSGHIDMILADGACDVGLESTIIDVSDELKPVILRTGAITSSQISDCLDGRVVEHDTDHKKDGDTIRSPGQLLKHYAPSVPVRINAIDVMPGEALLAFSNDRFMGVRGGGSVKDLPETAYRNLSETGDLNEAASNLFRMLHELDRPEHTAIAVMNIPDNGLGKAMNERLKRASMV